MVTSDGSNFGQNFAFKVKFSIYIFEKTVEKNALTLKGLKGKDNFKRDLRYRIITFIQTKQVLVIK